LTSVRLLTEIDGVGVGVGGAGVAVGGALVGVGDDVGRGVGLGLGVDEADDLFFTLTQRALEATTSAGLEIIGWPPEAERDPSIPSAVSTCRPLLTLVESHRIIFCGPEARWCPSTETLINFTGTPTFSLMSVDFDTKAYSCGYVMAIAGWIACACEARSSSSAKGMNANLAQKTNVDQQVYFIAPPSS